MIDAAQVNEIVRTYTKHDWLLRRVSLTVETEALLGAIDLGVPIVRSDVDAAWFSRNPADGAVAWEVRYLGGIPYSLVEHLDERSPDFETRIKAVEERLTAAVAAKRTS
jgi:hypothetical protein